VRALVACHRFPFPPARGGKIRPFNIIRHLSAQGHEVTVASLARDASEAAAGAGIAQHCREYFVDVAGRMAPAARMLMRLPTPVPSSFGYFYSASLAAQIRQRLAKRSFDFVFVHCSSAAQLVGEIDDLPRLLDFGDMDSQKWLEYARYRAWPLSWGYRLEGAKLEREERRLASRFDFVSCTTRAELETLDALGSGTRSGWFPNGVDSAFFAPTTSDYDRDLICFVGRMDYYPNQQAVQEFCRDVWPSLRSARKNLRFAIVGASPPAHIQSLARLDGVSVTGSVPDVRPIVSRACATVAPLRIARGTQNKILESLAMGVPVICSEIASRGVDVVAGQHLLTANTAEEYRDAILSVVDQPAERTRLGEAGRARVLSHHSWSSSMRRLDGLIEECHQAFRERKPGGERTPAAA